MSVPTPPPPSVPRAAERPGIDAVEDRIARMLSVGAIVAVALLVLGVVLMLAAGIDPESVDFPVFDPGALVGDLLALRLEGFLWAGILVVISTPILRVIGEAIGFALVGERWLALVATGILVVIAASVVIALAAEGALA